MVVYVLVGVFLTKSFYGNVIGIDVSRPVIFTTPEACYKTLELNNKSDKGFSGNCFAIRMEDK